MTTVRNALTPIAGLMAFCLVAPLWADNRIADGEFADGLDYWEWSEGRSGASAQIDTEQAYRGEQSLRLTGEPHGDRERIGTGEVTYTATGLEPDTLYRLSFWYKGENLGRTWVGDAEGDGPRLYPPRNGRTFDWQQAELLYRTGEDQTEWTFEIALNPSVGDGPPAQHLWIDDVQLAAVSDDEREEAQPLYVWLSWQRDPTSTMTIYWMSHMLHLPREAVEWKKAGDDDWQSQQASYRPLPHSDRLVHLTELTGLEPGEAYRFRFGDDSEEFQFRTMPAELNEPIRFVVGGDLYHHRGPMQRVNRQAAAQEPLFVAIAGDWSYANGNPERVERWYHLLEDWQENAVTPEGNMVPFVPGIGNHEVRGGYRPGQRGNAPFWWALFEMPDDSTYYALDVGDYLSMVALDTDHQAAVEGEQTEWLESALGERQGRFQHVFPFYHVPAYPSVRDYDGSISESVREHWVPLFEQYGVRVVFEAHDHAYKRTHPIRSGEVDEEDGIVYLGDGCWGVGIRTPRTPDEEWYLAYSGEYRHFYLVELDGESATFIAIDDQGEEFDRYELP